MLEADSTAASRLIPLDAPPFAMRMGVRRLDPAAWLDADESRLAGEVALKAELLAGDRGRYLVDDGTDLAAAASGELERAVGGWWAARGDEPPVALDDHPLVRAALRTQEDWCLLADGDARGGRPVLVAACVCFPTRWVLTEKLGLPLTAIHRPVAGYADALGSPVDRLLAGMEPDRVVWRANWNLVDDAALSQPYVPAPGRRLDATPEEAADLVWFRVERQTLRRLPHTGAIAFGIRVHQRTVRELVAEPGAAARLLAAVEALPPATFDYKGAAAFWGALRPWLVARARRGRR